MVKSAEGEPSNREWADAKLVVHKHEFPKQPDATMFEFTKSIARDGRTFTQSLWLNIHQLKGDRPATRFTNRVRQSNWTQIFTSSVEVSGTELAVAQIGVDDELDYQKQERLRELIRDLENCVINGVSPAATQQGSGSVRRTMNGIVPLISTNAFANGANGFPSGGGGGSDELTEEQINTALRNIWDQSAGHVDTIVVNGFQKRKINAFITSGRQYAAGDSRFSEMVGVYESDFGVCRVVLSRWVPADTVLLLDSSRVDVLPLAGRSFHFKRLASDGDKEVGQVIGEYTLEMRNENAHGLIRGLATS
ncbi:MAG: phage head protein [Phycisphaera sp.]|nr:phage head protein [Phycisphaera sp.]